MEEIWKPIEGFDNYKVSTLGRVYRIQGYGCKKERFITPKYDKYGYILYKLYNKGSYKFKLAHRLVAEAFIPNPDNLPEVNHKDCVRLNNSVDNLEWCTTEYNQNFRKVNSTKHKDVNAVLQINSDGEVLNSYRNIREASNYTDIIQNRIKLCIDGKIPQAGGYIWRYKY
jgi:hypothetical protein